MENMMELANLGILSQQRMTKWRVPYDTLESKQFNSMKKIVNTQMVADPDKNFVVIMKDGKIYKNTLND